MDTSYCDSYGLLHDPEDGDCLGCKQQGEIKQLNEQVGVLRDSYNKLCDALTNGEHVEMCWVKESIDEAAHSKMSRVYQSEIRRLERQLKAKTEIIGKMNNNDS